MTEKKGKNIAKGYAMMSLAYQMIGFVVISLAIGVLIEHFFDFLHPFGLVFSSIFGVLGSIWMMIKKNNAKK